MEEKLKALIDAARNAYYELNTIKARDGVPYTSDGWKSCVDENYFASVVDNLREALEDYDQKFP